MRFKIESEFDPTGDQPSAIKQLAQGIEINEKYQTLLGVTGSGKTFTVANVIQEVQRPTLVLAHNKTLAAQLYSEFKQFFPENAVEYFVSYYDYYQPEAYIPTSGTYIEKDLSINEEIEKKNKSIAVLQPKLDDLQDQISNRHVQIERKISETQRANVEIQEMGDCILELADETKVLEKQLTVEAEKYEKEVDSFKTLDAKKTNYVNRITALKKENEGIQYKYEILNKERELLLKSIDERKADQQRLEEEVSEYGRKIQKCENDKDSIMFDIGDTTSRSEELKKQVTTLSESLRLKERQLKNFEWSQIELQSVVERERQFLKSLEDDIEKLDSEMEKKKIIQLENEKIADELRTDSERRNREAADKRQKIAMLKSEVEATKKYVRDLRSELSAVSIEEVEIELDSKTEELANAQNNLETIQERYNDYKARISRKRAEKERVEAKTREILDIIKEKKDAIQEFEEISKVLDSKILRSSAQLNKAVFDHDELVEEYQSKVKSASLPCLPEESSTDMTEERNSQTRGPRKDVTL